MIKIPFYVKIKILMTTKRISIVSFLENQFNNAITVVDIVVISGETIYFVDK